MKRDYMCQVGVLAVVLVVVLILCTGCGTTPPGLVDHVAQLKGITSVHAEELTEFSGEIQPGNVATQANVDYLNSSADEARDIDAIVAKMYELLSQ